MLNTPQAVKVLKHNPNIIPIILEHGTFFEIVIDGEHITPQRPKTPLNNPRQFKTLAAAHAFLRNFLEYQGEIIIKASHSWLIAPSKRPNKPFFGDCLWLK